MNRGNNRENSGMQCSAVVEEKTGRKAEDPPWAAEWGNITLCWNKAKGSEKVKAADVNALTYCHSRLAFSEAAEKMTQFRWLKNKSQASVDRDWAENRKRQTKNDGNISDERDVYPSCVASVGKSKDGKSPETQNKKRERDPTPAKMFKLAKNWLNFPSMKNKQNWIPLAHPYSTIPESQLFVLFIPLESFVVQKWICF